MMSISTIEISRVCSSVEIVSACLSGDYLYAVWALQQTSADAKELVHVVVDDQDPLTL